MTKKSRGRTGSILKDPDGNIQKYTLNDVLYLLARQSRVRRTLEFLNEVFSRDVDTLIFLCGKYNLSLHMIGILKDLRIIDDQGFWMAKKPTWGLAVDVQLAYWKHFKEQKNI